MGERIPPGAGNDYIISSVNNLIETVDKHSEKLQQIDYKNHENEINQVRELHAFEDRLKTHIDLSLEKTFELLSKADKEQDRKITEFLDKQNEINESFESEIKALKFKPQEDAYNLTTKVKGGLLKYFGSLGLKILIGLVSLSALQVTVVNIINAITGRG
jgi:hypothetical protein